MTKEIRETLAGVGRLRRGIDDLDNALWQYIHEDQRLTLFGAQGSGLVWCQTHDIIRSLEWTIIREVRDDTEQQIHKLSDETNTIPG